MELLQLRYFAKLAESEHLTHTAEKLHISPPSLSASIKKLESYLNIALFDRKGNRLILNDNGKAFYQTVKRSLAILDEGIEVLRPLNNDTISVALTSQSVYLDMIYNFEHKFPMIPIKTHTITYDDVTNDDTVLNSYDFYLGIIEDLDLSKREIIQLYSSENPVVMISSLHPLATKKALRLSELQDMPFISITQENSSASQFVQRVFQEANFSPIKIYEGNYVARQKMVKENKAVGITTMVGAVANSLIDKSVTFIPVLGVSETRTQSISWVKGKKLTSFQRDFLLFAKNYFKEHPWRI